MAHHQSAQKAIRKTQRQTLVNRMRVSRIKTFIRKIDQALQDLKKASDADAGKAEVRQAFRQAESEIMKGATKGVIHRNAASRKVSRLAARIRKAF